MDNFIDTKNYKAPLSWDSPITFLAPLVFSTIAPAAYSIPWGSSKQWDTLPFSWIAGKTTNIVAGTVANVPWISDATKTPSHEEMLQIWAPLPRTRPPRPVKNATPAFFDNVEFWNAPVPNNTPMLWAPETNVPTYISVPCKAPEVLSKGKNILVDIKPEAGPIAQTTATETATYLREHDTFAENLISEIFKVE
jgi:hypothetical protein